MRLETMLCAILTAIILTISGAYSYSQDAVIPNDPLFPNQISFLNPGGNHTVDLFSYKSSPEEILAKEGIDLNITKAWRISTGSRRIVVALIDDGFYYNHEDLSGNIWKNMGETGLDEKGFPKETNGVDDDGNGYIDDVMGWDFVFNDPDPDCYIFDGKDVNRIQPYWHSISGMGIIGARGNNGLGVAGINWEISMMLLKPAAQGTTNDKRVARTAKAIRYAVDNGARVINWSGFVQEKQLEEVRVLKEAIDYAEDKGVLLVAACGNSKKNIDERENYFYPVCFENNNIISVAEVDFDGELYVVPEGSKYIGGSNFGVKNVDIAAIAQNYTTFLKNNSSVYIFGGGTSDAAPVVTGVAALVLSVRPELSGPELKEILMKSVTQLPTLKGKVKSGGMINALAALKLAMKK